MLTTNDQELKRLGMAGMNVANKKFDSFFVCDLFQACSLEVLGRKLIMHTCTLYTGTIEGQGQGKS